MNEKENKVSLKAVFKDGVLLSNPLFVSLLGLCPALAITTKFMNAIGMTIAFFLVLLASNVVISLLRNLIPGEIRIPVYIIIVATFVTCVALLMEAFTPELYSNLSTFINLIVVNCIILGRAEAFASKNTVVASTIDAMGQSLGYGLGLLVIALIREVLGTQSLTFSNPFNAAQSYTIPLLTNFKIEFFNSSAGAFVTLAIVLAVIAAITNATSKKKGAK
ncbi:MAG: electron transport complex subunit RsxE [Erysipelotrichaceae bacterium]|nr:electron transport complex subunit RsxE [Erysipelotrichaceae bacterium]